jgi:uncharacterized protein YkwD
MNTSRLLKAALGGALLTLGFALLSATPMHTAPAATAISELPSAASHVPHADNDDAPSAVKASQAEQFFFDATNRERAEQSLPQLKWDEALAVAARKHAALMADKNELSHRLSGEAELSRRTVQAGARFSMVGENVAIGPDSDGIHTGWMHSPGHRAKILGADFTALGVGVVERDGQLYAVEDFSHAVENLNREQQEKQVGAMLTARGFHLSPSRDDATEARHVCEAGFPRHGNTNSAHPNMQVLQYETADLASLGAQLDQKLRNSAYRIAAVGACQEAKSEEGIPRFRVVILLFPQVS